MDSPRNYLTRAFVTGRGAGVTHRQLRVPGKDRGLGKRLVDHRKGLQLPMKKWRLRHRASSRLGIPGEVRVQKALGTLPPAGAVQKRGAELCTGRQHPYQARQRRGPPAVVLYLEDP